MKRFPFPARLVPSVFALTTFALGLGLAKAKREVDERAQFARELAQVHVIAPEDAPTVSQDAIDLALVMYGIEVPEAVEHPVLDPSLEDRGLTTRGAFMAKAKVAVGPAAFTSWALLGTTLAHEIEVHCHQNFLAIYVMDLVGLDGTGAAERQAYAHELRNAARFGLGPTDASLIADTMEFYYPDGASHGMPRIVRNWLARNVLREARPL